MQKGSGKQNSLMVLEDQQIGLSYFLLSAAEQYAGGIEETGIKSAFKAKGLLGDSAGLLTFIIRLKKRQSISLNCRPVGIT